MADRFEAEEPADTTSGGRFTVAMASVDALDLERVEPPVGLWDRIAASTADAPTSGVGTIVEYAIDADDFVVSFGGEWADFARANDAPELVSVASDRTLWTYFDGDPVRDLWRVLVDRARSTGTQAHVPFRCDGPGMRRWFEMTVTPRADRSVHFRSVLAFEDVRPEIALLGRYSEHDSAAAAIPLCSWCGRGHDGSGWLQLDQLVHANRALEEVPVPGVSHGICPDCADSMSFESERLHSKNRP